jgi:hypothetical protein
VTEKSIFREFIATLRRSWKKGYPSFRPLTESRGGLPKASSFYAGTSRRSNKYVYLNFQHNSKSWWVGRFTINVVLSSDEYNPMLGGEGSNRIGHLIGIKDKWWHLKQDDDPIITEAWRPSTYDNRDMILSEAVEDVTHDVLCAMKLLDVPVEGLSNTA